MLGLFLVLGTVSLALFLLRPDLAFRGPVHAFTYAFHLKHHWSMFTPAPSESTRYFIRIDWADGATREAALPAPARTYAWKVYWDVFWADLWNSGLKEGLGVALAERLCGDPEFRNPQGEPPVRITLHVSQRAHGSTRESSQRIGRAGCPLPTEEERLPR